MTIATLQTLQTPQTPPVKPRKPYTKRTSKNAQEEQPDPVKKILKEELLGWNENYKITYFFEKVELYTGEIKETYATILENGSKIYSDLQPKIDNLLEAKKPVKPVGRPAKRVFL